MKRTFDGMTLALVVAACGVGCGGDDDETMIADAAPGGGADAAPGSVDAAPGAPDAALPAGQWEDLIQSDWTQPGGESYWCARRTFDTDTYIAGFRSIDPNGTHHAVFSVSEPRGDDNAGFSCSVSTLQDAMLFASGVGTDDLYFPPGVAVKVAAGTQVHMNLHLFNTGDDPISGRSGAQMYVVSESDVDQLAESVLAGPFELFINANPEPQSLSGTCTFEQEMTIINVWPHMHQVGSHMKVTRGSTVLHDEDFDFYEQVNYPIEPYTVPAGNKITIECTWRNTTGSPIVWGDSTESEMCFAGLYRYPAADQGLFCTDGFQPF